MSFWLLAFLLISPASLIGANSAFEIPPYVQDVTETSAAVLWKSGAGTTGRAEYGPTMDYGASIESRTEWMAEKGTGEAREGNVARTRLVDLQPDTTYHYRVMLSSSGSADRTFRTAPSGDGGAFTFLVYGDSRSNPETYARVISAASTCEPAFVLTTGDAVSSNDAGPSVWMKQFFRPAEPLLRKTWFLLIRGNHESTNRLFSSYFGGAGRFQNEDYHGFDWGPVHVVTINTNKDYSPGSEQYEFLRRDLGGNSRPFKVFFGHHPPFSSGLHGSTKRMQEYLQPLLEEGGVRLVFSGHDHSYERTIVKGVTYIVSGGGGAPLYAQQNTLKNSKSLVYMEAYHFVRVDVTAAELVLTAWAVDEKGAAAKVDQAIIRR